jgi:hypothetical protein
LIFQEDNIQILKCGKKKNLLNMIWYLLSIIHIHNCIYLCFVIN